MPDLARNTNSGNAFPGPDASIAPLKSESGRREMADALNLATVLSLLLAGLAVVLFLGWKLPVQWLDVALASAFLVVLARWAAQRISISRHRLPYWRGALFGLCLLQGATWVPYLTAVAGNHDTGTVLGMVAGITALAPLVYWLPGLLLALALSLFWVWGGVPAPIRLWIGSGLFLATLFGLIANHLLVEQRRAKARERASRKALGEVKSDCLDTEERLRYGQEQLESCQRELVEVRKLASAAGQAKTEFLATISHEIRTPLNGILPTLEMLQGTQLNEDQQRYVRAATSSSRHLLRIINDLLDFARAESGKLQLESIELNLEELVQSVLDLMAGSAERKGLRLKLRLSEQLPRVVRGDPIRLRQILANLLSNAIKFTEQGSVELSVEPVRSGRREVVIRFNVRDTGIGLARKEARNLFNSFTQADASTTRKHGGTGLGLVICRRLVELMGGQIGVRSLPGQGSNFWFELPVRRSSQDLPAARNSLEGARLISAIADNELAAQVSQQLKAWGVREESVASVDVLQRLHDTAALGKSWAFECLLLDSLGSEQQVISLLREIRSDFLTKSLKIIVLTETSEAAERLHEEFSVYVLNGRFKPESLHRLLNRLFDVASGSGYAAEQQDPLAYLDLNIERESVLVSDATTREERGGSTVQVLLAEDNPVNLGVVQHVLRGLGVECLAAENGQQALEMLRQEMQVDMVLMDCQMPVMDGYEATRLWREYEKHSGGHTPVVAMTANAMPGDREKCIQAGMDDYVSKPVNIAELEGMIGKWVYGEGASSFPEVPARPVTEPEQHDLRMLDRSVLAELREVVEDGFGRLVGTYLEHAPELMDGLKQASTKGDVEAMVAPAHSLKSSSANMGALKLSILAREVEMAARQGDLNMALAAYRKMPTIFLKTCASLRSELKPG